MLTAADAWQQKYRGIGGQALLEIPPRCFPMHQGSAAARRHVTARAPAF